MSIDNEKWESGVTEDMEWEQDVVFNTPVDRWSTVDLHSIIKSRRKRGITEYSFDQDSKYYSDRLNRLVVYDSDAMSDELSRMDYSCPANEHDFSKLEIRYSQLVGHLVRLNEMYKIINAHVLEFDAAYKSLKTTALGLSSGTAKDKEANAEFMVQPLFAGLISAKKMIGQLDDAKKAIEFAAMNLNRILQGREPERMMSGNAYAREGQVHSYQNAMEQDIDEEGYVSTRKRLK